MPQMKSPTKVAPTKVTTEDNNVSARRLKKREIDRRCQRQARERTKSRITYLEGLVDNLRQSDADERSAALMRRLADTEKERDALAQTLKEIQKALSAHGPEIKTEPDLEESWTRDNDVETVASPLEDTSDNINIINTNADPYPYPSQGEDGAERLDQDIIDADLPRVCDDACECCREARKGPNGTPKSLWRHANNALLEPYQGNSPITPDEDLLAEDMPIRIVMEGWDAVDQQFGLPISWKFLRQIDESLFAVCGPTERLAILRTMHLLLQYHRDPTPERRAKLPAWFLARPSQSLPHAYAINYFVWPGLRERFIFQQHKYCSNLFWQFFSGSFEMAWPYDFRDCFAQRWDTGGYQLTPNFQDCLSDISRWTMKSEMFMQFPDLRCDIPASTTSPRPVSNIVQLQLGQMKPFLRGGSTTMPQTTKQTLNDETTRQHQFLENWGLTTPWMDNPMLMASPADGMIAASWNPI